MLKGIAYGLIGVSFVLYVQHLYLYIHICVCYLRTFSFDLARPSQLMLLSPHGSLALCSGVKIESSLAQQ